MIWVLLLYAIGAIWSFLPASFWVLMLLSPFFTAVLQEYSAWRSTAPSRWGFRQMNGQQLGSYTAKRLTQWKNKLYRQRGQVRQRLRRLQQEQAMYQKAKAAHEQQLQQDYQPQMQQLLDELGDHHQAWRQTLAAYDARAKALIREEQAALQLLPNEQGKIALLEFPILLSEELPQHSLRAAYHSQHQALLAEAQQALAAHRQALEAYLQAWSQQVQLPQQLLKGNYRSILGDLDQLDQQVSTQKIALDALDQRLKAVRQALK